MPRSPYDGPVGRSLLPFVVAAILALLIQPWRTALADSGEGGYTVPPAYQELFDQSMKEKKGLVFFVKGQSIPGIVTKVGDATVEARNQTYGRIVIRIERIDALAIN